MAMSVRTCSPTSPLLVRHTLTVVMRNFPPVAPIRCAYPADLHALTKQYLRVRVVKYVRIVLRSDTSDRVRHPKASSQPPDHLHARKSESVHNAASVRWVRAVRASLGMREVLMEVSTGSFSGSFA